MRQLGGVIAAMPTPLTEALEPDLAAVPALLDDLVDQGCHGALVLGTTGEGPSFSVAEREAILTTAAAWRAAGGHDHFVMVGGSGCANLPETIALSRHAIELGYDAVLVVPPYFFKHVTAVGVARAYAAVLDELPDDARLLLYHIPQVTGVPVGPEVISSLRSSYGPLVAGLKDSGADLAATRSLIATFPELVVLTGTDSHLLPALDAGAAGCITALASACGDILRAAYDAQRAGTATPADRSRLEALRQAAEGFPLAAAVKTLLHDRRRLGPWPVRPPLVDLSPAEREDLVTAVRRALAP